VVVVAVSQRPCSVLVQLGRPSASVTGAWSMGITLPRQVAPPTKVLQRLLPPPAVLLLARGVGCGGATCGRSRTRTRAVVIALRDLRVNHHHQCQHHQFRSLHQAGPADQRTNSRVIDGRALADQILAEIKAEMQQLASELQRPPHLAMICVAPNYATQSYMMMKQRACQRVGFTSSVEELSADIGQETLIRHVTKFSQNPSVDGLIVQLPLPQHIDPLATIVAIDRDKDVDGLHPSNMGAAVLGIEGGFLPCTPAGVLETLKRSNVSLDGKHVVVVGRSKLVGLPLATMLLSRKVTSGQGDGAAGPTVTVVHSGTRDIHVHTKSADIIIVAAGHADLITADSVKDGAVIIDVGINHKRDTSHKAGFRLVGDCSPDAYAKASQYTPVPGGIGPMTVAMLMRNTWRAAKQNQLFSSKVSTTSS